MVKANVKSVAICVTFLSSIQPAFGDALAWLKDGEYACFSERSVYVEIRTGNVGPWVDSDGNRMHPNFSLNISRTENSIEAQTSLVPMISIVYAVGNPDREAYLDAIFGNSFSMSVSPQLSFVYSVTHFDDEIGPITMSLNGACSRL